MRNLLARLIPTAILLLSFFGSRAHAEFCTTSPNMSMCIPVVGVEPGPQYATDINNALTTLDSHNHTSGQGVQVPTAGLNINADLTFASNNATNLRSCRFTPQTIFSAPADVGALYESGVDLYYRDGNGNNIRMTQSGGVALGGVIGFTTLQSGNSNPATVGQIRLANTDAIDWRNAGNSNNLALTPSASGDGFLAYGGVDLVGTSLTQTLTNKKIFASDNTGLDASNYLANYSLAASVATNALTVALKDKGGSDPSATSKAVLGFRNATSTTGTYSVQTVTGALPITIPSGTTIGTSNGVTTYIYVYALNNAGTVELAVSLSGAFDEAAVQTTTAVSGGSSATTLYSTTARFNVPVRLIGRIAISEATAGTWASAPTEVSNVPFRSARQVVVGAAQTTQGTTTSATYAAFTNTPSVTFTALRTGLYKIWGNFAVSGTSAGAVLNVQIAATAGSPTVIFNQTSSQGVPSASSFQESMAPYLLVQLTAGTSYTFQVQGKISAGTAKLENGLVDNGQVLVAEEL